MTIVDFGQEKQKRDLLAAIMQAAQQAGLSIDQQKRQTLEKIVGNYIVESQPYYNEPNGSRDDAWAPRPDKSKQAYVFFPFGWAARGISRSYVGFRYADGEFHSLVLDHLPTPDEVARPSALRQQVRRKKLEAEKTLDDDSIQQRLDALLNNNFWREDSNYSYAPVNKAVKNIFSAQHDISPLLNDESLRRLGHMARTDMARLIQSALSDDVNIADEKTKMAERWHRYIGGAHHPLQHERGSISITLDMNDGSRVEAPSFATEVEKILEAYELQQKKEVLQEFMERVDPMDPNYDTAYHPRGVPADKKSIDMLATLPAEYQTRNLYKFLTPLQKTRIRNSDFQVKKKNKRQVTFINGAAGAKRREFLEEFPFMAASFSASQGFYHHRKDMFSEFAEAEHVAQELLIRRYGFGCNYKSQDDEIINFLRGLTAADMGHDIAADPVAYTPYLRLLRSSQFPQTPKEWQYFKALVEADKFLVKHEIKQQGEALAELAADGKSLQDMAYPLHPVETRNGIQFSYLQPLVNYMNDYGKAVFLPALIEIFRDVYYASRHADPGLHGYMAKSGFAFPDRIDNQYNVSYSLDEELQKILLPLVKTGQPAGAYPYKLAQKLMPVLRALEEKNIPSYLAADIDISDFLRNASAYEANCDAYFEWRELRPRVEEFIKDPTKQNWLGLPTPATSERQEAAMPLALRNIAGLLALKQAFNACDVAYNDRRLVTEVRDGTQYFMLTQPRDGDVVCIARTKLESHGALNIFAWDEKDVLFPDSSFSSGQHGNAMPAVKETLDGYSEWLAQKHPDHTAERHKDNRAALFAQPLRGGNRISDIVGHDVFNLTENAQVMNYLKRYSAWPLKTNPVTDKAEIDGLQVLGAKIIGAMFNTEPAHILRLLDKQSGGQPAQRQHLRIV
ncbi:MAG: hypothetical protein GC136_01095 [Alphaproteobacteria bacterium]|nr:hypothetical protein [Alphaproteobacteria bacterium]